MKKKHLLVGVLIFIFLIGFVYYFFFKTDIKKDEALRQNEQQHEEELLASFLFAINVGNFMVEECEELTTEDGKQLCYKTFIVRKIIKEEIIEKNICLKLIEIDAKELCLLHAARTPE